MEVITIDGTTYRKASTVAKDFKYTADYIGQLCRARKVDSKLIGRTWYVNPESVIEHRGGRYTTTPRAAEKINTVALESRVIVEPVFRKSTAKSLEYAKSETAFSKRINWGPVKYEMDDSSLLPDMARPAQRLSVKLEEAGQVTVTGDSKATNLYAEELPEVVLKGKVAVESIADDFESVAENIDISDNEFFSIAPEPEINTPPLRQRTSRKNDHSHVVSIHRLDEPSTQIVAAATTTRHPESPISFTPKRLQASLRTNKIPDARAAAVEPAKISRLTMVTLVIFSALAFAAVSVLEFSITASSTEFENTIAW